MKINIIFIVALFACMPAHGWFGSLYAGFITGCKNIFSYSHVQNSISRRHANPVLKEFANQVKANLDAYKKQVVQNSKSMLVEQLRAPDESSGCFP